MTPLFRYYTSCYKKPSLIPIDTKYDLTLYQ